MDEPEVTVPVEVSLNGAPEPEAAAPAPVVPRAVETAFLVYTDAEGHFQAVSDIEQSFIVGRPATLHDFYHAAADITKDIEAFEVSARVVGMQAQMAQQAMAQARAQQEAQQILQGIGDPKGGLLLNRQTRRHQ